MTARKNGEGEDDLIFWLDFPNAAFKADGSSSAHITWQGSNNVNSRNISL